MAETISFVPVEWFIEDSTLGRMVDYRSCDLCGDSACTDAMDGLESERFRQFTKQHGGRGDGLIICEHCMTDYLNEPEEL